MKSVTLANVVERDVRLLTKRYFMTANYCQQAEDWLTLLATRRRYSLRKLRD